MTERDPDPNKDAERSVTELADLQDYFGVIEDDTADELDQILAARRAEGTEPRSK